MGGSAVVVMLLGLIRTKFAAVLIGATGVGLIASYTAIQSLVATISGLGLGSSAVREIAKAVGTDDEQGISRSISTLRRLSFFTGLAGMCILIVSSPIISKITFDTNKYSLDVAILGVVVLMSNLSAANIAILQGLRRVNAMASTNIYSASIGTVCAITFFYSMDLRGIAPALLAIALAQYVVSRHFVQKQGLLFMTQSWRETFLESKTIVGLGFTFMWSALLVSLVGYITIYLVNQSESVQMVGIYSAAFTLSGIFVGFVLNAMSADYYPRLTAMANDKAAVNRLVVEQTEIGLLLAVPGLLASIIFAPWLVHGLYSKEFMLAVPLLQWFIVGCLGRIVSWPMGFIMLALGKDRWFFAAETVFNLVHVAAIGIALWLFGIEGIAFAFAFVYLAHIVAMYFISKRLIDFSFNSSYMRLLIISVVTIVVGLFITRQLEQSAATTLGVFLVIVSLIYSLRGLLIRVDKGSSLARILVRIPMVKKMVQGINQYHD